MEHPSLSRKIETMLTHQKLFSRNTLTDVGVNMIVHVRTQMSHHPATYDVKASSVGCNFVAVVQKLM